MTQEELYQKIEDLVIKQHTASYSDLIKNFLRVEEKLDRVEIQTTKTNGRVTALEEKVRNSEEKIDSIGEITNEGKNLVSSMKLVSSVVGVLLTVILSVGFYAYQHDIGTLKDEIDTLKNK